eukprot:maker-scaffold356_size197960-snap-gene-0.35 protein:Tk00532 transcript:maker-scaffold356_size197960-snap-gene-0.35-mRNA-1 annotation:"trna wybutosine-synthesizing protein 4"
MEGTKLVELTNIEAQRSKLSLVKKGYRHDVFLERLFQMLGLQDQFSVFRSSAIDQGYLLRAIAMEQTFERTLIELSLSGQEFQVLNLGAGFDLAYFRLSNAGILGSHCRYFEVDLPSVMRDKATVIASSPLFHACLGRGHRVGSSCFQFQNYALIGCDLTDISGLWDKLGQCGFKPSLLTVIVSECALTYVPEAAVSGLIRHLVHRLDRVQFFLYEQIQPHDSFGQIMCNHFQNRNTPLRNVASFPTVGDHIRRLVYLGVPGEVTCSPLTEYLEQNFTLSELLQRMKSDPSFDEFEELFLKCQHYVILTALWGKSTDPVMPIRIKNKVIRISRSHLSPWLRRFGHSVVATSDHVWVIGGYAGKRDGFLGRVTSNRLDDFVLHDRDLSIYSGTCLIRPQNGSSEWILAFGGRASPLGPSGRLLAIRGFQVTEIQPRGRWRPSPRWKHTLTSTGSANRVLLVGGRDQSRVFKDIMEYRVGQRDWVHRGCLAFGLFSHATVGNSLGDKCYVSGGLKHDQKSLNRQILILHWTPSGRINRENWSHPSAEGRFGHTSHIWDSKLILVGGITARGEGGVSVIHLNSNSWQNYDLDIPRNVPLTLYNHGSTLDETNGKLCVFGGGGNCFSFGMHVAQVLVEIDLGCPV